AVSNLKPYDGTITAAAVPTITAGSIQTGDTEPAWTETYDSPAIGSGKTLTPAGVVLDGNGGANYNYTYAPVTTGGIIDGLVGQATEGGFTLSWPPNQGWILRQSDSVTGPWTDVITTTNWYQVVPTQPSQYYRLRPGP
ncbi:MAG: YDG domain-containing protein, partial [Verrucomicrobia bacterium]|nr:YDG domain-containing protein [Verrucomicrobiota bacterium]